MKVSSFKNELLLVRGTYWSIICCCSSIGTILCNSISQYVHNIPSSIFTTVGFFVVILSVATYLLFPSYDESVLMKCISKTLE